MNLDANTEKCYEGMIPYMMMRRASCSHVQNGSLSVPGSVFSSTLSHLHLSLIPYSVQAGDLCFFVTSSENPKSQIYGKVKSLGRRL